MEEREVRIYKYCFSDGSFIEVEANNRIQARKLVNELVFKNLSTYAGLRLTDEYVTKPCQDVSKKTVNGITYIWIGFEISPMDGWMEYNKYKYLRSLIPIKGSKIK